MFFEESKLLIYKNSILLFSSMQLQVETPFKRSKHFLQERFRRSYQSDIFHNEEISCLTLVWIKRNFSQHTSHYSLSILLSTHCHGLFPIDCIRSNDLETTDATVTVTATIVITVVLSSVASRGTTKPVLSVAPITPRSSLCVILWS